MLFLIIYYWIRKKMKIKNALFSNESWIRNVRIYTLLLSSTQYLKILLQDSSFRLTITKTIHMIQKVIHL
jgi:hypothetical protein